MVEALGLVEAAGTLALGFDLEGLIKAVGYIGIVAIVFAESGLLVGFFLPGDSLLFTAGFLASQGFLQIALLCVLVFVAAVAGDSFGYWCGRRYGPRVFRKEGSMLFSRDHLARSRAFYERHGPFTIVLARFVPIVRTFAPILAGVGVMRYRVFLTFNVMGAALWAFGVTLLGYWLGSAIPGIDRYLLPIIAAIILVSLAPSAIHILRSPQGRRQAWVVLVTARNRLRGRRRRGGEPPRAATDREG